MMFTLKVRVEDDGDAASSTASTSVCGDTSQGGGAGGEGFGAAAAAGAGSIAFSWGHGVAEAFRGVAHLYREVRGAGQACVSEPGGALPVLPEGRNPGVCVLAVPAHMTGADFCQFLGGLLQSVATMRMVRNTAQPYRYMVLIEFCTQDAADTFYLTCNNRAFSTLEPQEVCHIVFTKSVAFNCAKEAMTTPPAGLTELPTCPVCLERLDSHISGVLTTVCNHSFHCTCLSNWADSSCPVCRYCANADSSAACEECGCNESLWMCLICGYVACSRYHNAHAVDHWRKTQHCYSMELHTQRVWDYVGDNFVHRLIQSKTDGKLVELHAPDSQSRLRDSCGASCATASGSGEEDECCIHEAMLNSKLENMHYEYNHLLTSQLESQRQYFEGLMAAREAERQKELHIAAEKLAAAKYEKLTARLAKTEQEKEFLRQVNESLVKNQKQWQAKLLEAEERSKSLAQENEARIQDLEEQVRDLMVYIEAKRTLETSDSTELRDGSVISVAAPSTPSTGKATRKLSRKR
eukprot:jgi/Chlat1/1871/Chrsp141S02192